MARSALVRIVAVGIAMGSSACTTTPAAIDQSRVAADIDSIVLERTPCFGFCPTYRLAIDGSGRVRYRNAGERTVRTDSIAPDAVERLGARAIELGFFDLPARIRGDSALCSMVATDQPGVIVSFFSGAGSKTVDHYTGCHVEGRERPGPAPAIVRLVRLEAEIDSTANVEQWRPEPGQGRR